MTDEKMLNQDLDFSLCFFLEFGGYKLSKPVASARSQTGEFSLTSQAFQLFALALRLRRHEFILRGQADAHSLP